MSWSEANVASWSRLTQAWAFWASPDPGPGAIPPSDQAPPCPCDVPTSVSWLTFTQWGPVGTSGDQDATRKARRGAAEDARQAEDLRRPCFDHLWVGVGGSDSTCEDSELC